VHVLDLANVSVLVTKLIIIAFAAVVFVKLLTGGINTNHLLYGKKKDGRWYFSPGRVQLLVVTVFIAFGYFMSVLKNPNRTSLPDVDESVLALLFGSHAIYLGGKARALLFTALRKGE
jgi:hypothetical protein